MYSTNGKFVQVRGWLSDGSMTRTAIGNSEQLMEACLGDRGCTRTNKIDKYGTQELSQGRLPMTNVLNQRFYYNTRGLWQFQQNTKLIDFQKRNDKQRFKPYWFLDSNVIPQIMGHETNKFCSSLNSLEHKPLSTN